MFGLYPKTVPLESHSLTAEQLAAIAFSECDHILLPKHFETYTLEPSFLEAGYCLIASVLNKFGAFVYKAIALMPQRTLSVWKSLALS